jgi:ArsR family transcriptional regulator
MFGKPNDPGQPARILCFDETQTICAFCQNPGLMVMLLVDPGRLRLGAHPKKTDAERDMGDDNRQCIIPDEVLSPDLRPVDGPEVREELVELAKAIASPARIQILQLLARRKTCVCGEIVAELPLKQSTVSQHLKVLKSVGLVEGEIQGPKTCYYLNRHALRRLKALIAGL